MAARPITAIVRLLLTQGTLSEPLAERGRRAGAPRWWEKRRARKAADEWIAAGWGSRVAWRVDELTSRRERRLLARSLRGAVSDLSPGRLAGASPINRIALRPHARLLTALAERVADPERPVAATGVLAVHELLTSPDSAIYTHDDVDVRGELRSVLDALEVH